MFTLITEKERYQVINYTTGGHAWFDSKKDVLKHMTYFTTLGHTLIIKDNGGDDD